jgi:hypothetical protein
MAQPADQNAGGCLSPSLWSKREGAGARVPILTQAPLIAPHVDRSHIRSVPKNALVLSCAIDDEKPTYRYLSVLDERIGDLALVENGRPVRSKISIVTRGLRRYHALARQTEPRLCVVIVKLG